jgi:hypothetical protein
MGATVIAPGIVIGMVGTGRMEEIHMIGIMIGIGMDPWGLELCPAMNKLLANGGGLDSTAKSFGD